MEVCRRYHNQHSPCFEHFRRVRHETRSRFDQIHLRFLIRDLPLFRDLSLFPKSPSAFEDWVGQSFGEYVFNIVRRVDSHG